MVSYFQGEWVSLCKGVFVFWAGGLYYVINYLLTYLLNSDKARRQLLSITTKYGSCIFNIIRLGTKHKKPY